MFLINSLTSTPGLICCLLALAIVYFWRRRRSIKGLPPGPTGLPILGYLGLFKGGDPRPNIERLRKQYGDIFSLYIGNTLVVVVSGFSSVKDAFLKHGDLFSDRPKNFISQKVGKGKGFIGSSGAEWKEQRKFTLEVLRQYGYGKVSMETKIQDEVIQVLEILDKNTGPIDIANTLYYAVANLICSIVFGRRFEYDDPIFDSCMKKMNEIFRDLGASSVLNFFPLLEHIPGDLFKGKKTLDNLEYIRDNMFRVSIKQHKEELDDSDNTDFVFSYLNEIKKRKEAGEETYFSDEQLIIIVGDLFLAGTDTTVTSLRWALLYMMHYPEVQKRVQGEIDLAVGHGRFPTLKDRPHLTYTEATIMELQRITNIVPIPMAFCCSTDATLQGYHIPKGTTLLPNLHSVLHDVTLWGDPKQFRPERFLDKDNIVKPEHYIPFSIGRRVCLGESLAKMELFLFFSAILQQFTIEVPEGEPLPSLDGVFGVAVSPKPYKLCVRKR